MTAKSLVVGGGDKGIREAKSIRRADGRHAV